MLFSFCSQIAEKYSPLLSRSPGGESLLRVLFFQKTKKIEKKSQNWFVQSKIACANTHKTKTKFFRFRAPKPNSLIPWKGKWLIGWQASILNGRKCFGGGRGRGGLLGWRERKKLFMHPFPKLVVGGGGGGVGSCCSHFLILFFLSKGGKEGCGAETWNGIP